jgi:P27 family predicted phage terminase small subunit
MSKRLSVLGLFTEVDGELLALFAQTWDEMLLADEVIRDKGLTMPGRVTVIAKRDGSSITHEGGEVARPEVAIRRNAKLLLTKLGAEFGLGPSSRTRISVKPPVEDDLDKILGGSS